MPMQRVMKGDESMRYDMPAGCKRPLAPLWPKGVGGIAATLPDGTSVEVPVLQGVNTMVFGVVGTGKTRSYVLPAAERLLAADPTMKGVFFEVKTTFIRHFLQPGDKVITHDPNAVHPDHLFRPNLILEIRQAVDREGEMRQIADFLFGDLLDGANQNLSWVEAARNAFVGVLRVIVDCYPYDNTSNWTLVNALRRMSVEELLGYLAKHPRNHSLLTKDFNYDPEKAATYKPSRRAGDILFFFNQVLEQFSGAFECQGEDTIRNYLDGKYGRHLFFLYDLASAEISRPFMMYYLKKLKDAQMSNSMESVSPMLWVLDEIDKLSYNGKSADFGLFQAANLGRERKLQILLATQSMENLYGLSADFNAHSTVGGLAGFPAIFAFRPGEPATIETLQTLFGSAYREHIVMPLSRYSAPEIRYELEPVVTDTDFATLGTGDCYVKIVSQLPQKVHFIHPAP